MISTLGLSLPVLASLLLLAPSAGESQLPPTLPIAHLELRVTSDGTWDHETSDPDVSFHIEGQPGTWVVLVARAYLVAPVPGSAFEHIYAELVTRFGDALARVEGVPWMTWPSFVQASLLEGAHASVSTASGVGEDTVKSSFQPLFGPWHEDVVSRSWKCHTPIWLERKSQGHQTSIEPWQRILSPTAQQDEVFSAFNLMQHAVLTQMSAVDAAEFLKGTPPASDQSWLGMALDSGLLRVDVQALGVRSPNVLPGEHGATELGSPGLLGVPEVPPSVRLSNNVCLGIYVGAPGTGGGGPGFADSASPIELDVSGFVTPFCALLETVDGTHHVLVGELVDVGRVAFDIPQSAAVGPATLRWIANPFGRFQSQGAPWGGVVIQPPPFGGQ